MRTREELQEELARYEKREKELKSRIEELTDFIENIIMPLHWVDSEGIIIWANQAELDFLGYTKEEYIGFPLKKFHADQAAINDILIRLRNNETLRNYPARLLSKDGSVKHVLINVNVYRKDGKFIHTRCFTRDITEFLNNEGRKAELLTELKESKLASERINKSEKLSRSIAMNIPNSLIISMDITDIKKAEAGAAMLAEIVHSSDDAIISKTTEGIITSWNEAAERMFGYQDSEIIGKSVLTLIPPDRSEEEPLILARLRKGERVEHFETKRVTKDNKILDISLTISPIRDSRNNIIGLSKIARDITSKKLEERRKNDFIAMVSHELKTPLTSVKSYIQVLLAKARKEEKNFDINALSRAEVQTNKMTSMINDFLNLARLEEGKIHLHKVTFELQPVFEDMVHEAHFLASGHTVKLLDCGKIMIHADKDKIMQVLINLLSNAIKYSHNGSSVTIGCARKDEKVRIFVRDEGIGISHTDQKRLFERFYRVENEKLKNVSGFGIGLYLCSEILRYHGSKIEVESKEDKGSTFYFEMDEVSGKK